MENIGVKEFFEGEKMEISRFDDIGKKYRFRKEKLVQRINSMFGKKVENSWWKNIKILPSHILRIY